jgi:uncharacterized repeat protein (TIGR03803 family)
MIATLFRRLSFSLAAAALALAACSSRVSTGLLPGGAAVPERVAGAGGYKLLYLFKGGSGGAIAFAGLTRLGSTFYGVTYGDKVGPSGFGTVFSISASGKEKTLYEFKGMPSDGAEPAGNLLVVNGTLYGTTLNGGANNSGTLFTISPSGHEHVIHSFAGGTNDGGNPLAALIEVGGKLYGTTATGGSVGAGTVFDATTSGDEHILYSFKGYPKDGEEPKAPLIAVDGELYGTTYLGGKNRDGTVFKISTSGKEHVLHSFEGAPADGSGPYGGLTLVGKKQLYGTTYQTPGALYEISVTGKEKLLYPFKGGPGDGAAPAGGLVFVNHKLYGTTTSGGANEDGTIFEAMTSGDEQMLYSFKGSPKDGADPYGTLLDVTGTFYGTAEQGGNYITGGMPYPDAGAVYRFKP